MKVLIVFTIIATGLTAIAMAICSLIEGYSEHASLMAFLALFMGQFILAWIAAVHITERFFVTDSEREANARHIQEMESRFRAMGV